jgi:F-type H+-transporting ATPase subunit delta
VSSSSIGERYARALFELGDEAGQLDAVTRQVESIAEAYASSPELRGVLDNPLIEPADREAVMRAVAGRLGLGQVVLNAVRLMALRHRLGALPDVARALVRLADERLGILRAEVISAAPLPDAFCARLQGLLEQRTHQRVVLDRQLDPGLIAGVVTRIGDHVIDGSLEGRLAALERQLLPS